ncbi:Gfo/Idh/MocA family oxidoreductase [Marinihelvus fidelis]|uniref:Gfo/Idh/MocA family oxidoreductase n=1 Tax=Marinihelvus fidelis TaxID=2613842 RepID=A0A5N0TC08_9GAMM|nr:Gfo/Idh/MocA family oxidoreductase [Marinihelvus fidelis]KAA9131617.1 Gfo/Idh/MocA family oxidoreductase [Marinihelvus fidelis]
MSYRSLGIGLVGTGFMGRAHAIALRSVGGVFAAVPPPRLVHVVDADAGRAGQAAEELGFLRHGDDWQALLEDPDVDAVSICTPNHLHHEMAMAALAAGKHVWCEKPLALTVDEAAGLAAAAADSGRAHLVGFNYAVNPLLSLAREILSSGEIGEPVAFSGRYYEDYMADPAVPWSWRCDRSLAGSGALADLGSHLVHLLETLLGPVETVTGHVSTAVAARQDPVTGAMRAVENEDIASAHARLASGVPATLDISRVASGYKCGLAFDLFCSRGALRFDQERMNELQLFEAGQRPGRDGFRRLLAGPAHPDYAAFNPAPGHGLGYNDLKVIEARNFLCAAMEGRAAWPDFSDGLRVQRVMDAIERSAAAGQAVRVEANE